MNPLRKSLAALCLVLLSTSCTRTATPLLHAHAHNDYNHPRPLFDALDNGYTSIEPDVVLLGEELYVAHNKKDVTPSRTLESLYLKPLAQRIDKNHGHVYANSDVSVTLLIDFKTEPVPTYRFLKSTLARYDRYLTHIHHGQVERGPLTIILTGNKPREMIAREQDRVVMCDGVLSDLDSNPPVDLVPLISSKWEDSFSWKGDGPMPPAERQKLRTFAQRAHAQGRKLRFWGAPDNPATWKELREAGVDLINTDRLAECGRFLLKRRLEVY